MPASTVTRPRVEAVVDSPVGPLTLTAEDGALVALSMHDRRPPREPSGDATGVLAAASAQLGEYFAGERTAFDLPLRLDGTPFQRTVWVALTEIPYAETVSYGELARCIGRPGAARAVGLANGRNPIGIVVPCHRVIGASGDLTGYASGIERKRYLLALEQRVGGHTLALETRSQ